MNTSSELSQVRKMTRIRTIHHCLLVGTVTLLPITSVHAQNMSAVQGVPINSTPPPIPSLNDIPAETAPAGYNPTTTVQEYEFQSPVTPPAVPTSGSSISPYYTTPSFENGIAYRVEVDGTSDLLLSQVKSIDPQAFIRPKDGVIQAGIFADSANAQVRVQQLEGQGVYARIVTTDVASSIPSTPTLSAQNPNPQNSAQRSYFVVIPGQESKLWDIAARVRQSGLQGYAITQKDSPRGSHVAVGPFNNNSEASRWNTYLRSMGLDSRVYYGK